MLLTNRTDWLRHMAELSAEDATRELAGVDRELWGPNVLASSERAPLPCRLLAAFADPFTYILVGIACVSVATDWVFAAPSARDLSTPAVIGAMVLASGLLRFVQTEKSDGAAEALAHMIEATCSVEREGEGRVEIPVAKLAPGDVVYLSSGDLVPADLRIVRACSLFVSQSAITGESEPVELLATPLEDAAELAATDLRNIAFCGASVISGSGTGVVVATGAATLVGQASGGASARRDRTAASEGVAQVSRLLMAIMAAMLPVVFLACGITKGDWLDALFFALSVAVGLTPEMLPMLVTCCEAKATADLAHEEVIVRRLDAMSDLGGIDVLCCDKTGTLTEDQVALERHLDVLGNDDPRVLRLAFANSFYGTGMKNLVDSAIIRKALEVDPEVEALSERYELVDELPFDFERRRLSVVVAPGGGTGAEAAGGAVMVTKGALEEILGICAFAEVDGHAAPLTSDLCRDVLARAATLADEGMRVLGVAVKRQLAGCAAPVAEDENQMTLVGYLAFLDPPKASAAPALEALRDLGVAVKVLTGDSDRVAAHVCRTLGIPASEVLLGSQVDALGDEALAERAETCSVFAKLSPANKARVVAALRSRGHSVGFMGDGANDAAAMRASDCGISVDSAVDAAREAADVILLRKDLGVLTRGIEHGRRSRANTLKYIRITVSSNFGNVFSVLAASLALPFLPMSATQLLLLNLIYDLSCTALPWDNVGDALVREPASWDGAGIRRFMLRMGPVSSVFDLAMFAALYFCVCPAAAGGAWGSLDAAGQATFAATFQAGWFVSSMWTQTVAVQLLRASGEKDGRSPAAWQVTALDALGVALATALPFSPLAGALDLAPLPSTYWPVLAAVVAGYALALALARRFCR